MQTQQELSQRVSSNAPDILRFVKDKPILGWKISSENTADIPFQIRRHMGDVDQTDYSKDYLAKNVGSVIALQMDGDKADFYVIGLETFKNSYTQVATDEVAAKNSKLFDGVNGLPGMDALLGDDPSDLVGALKTTRVEMVRLSDLGYEQGKELTIESPWGEQTKPAGDDAFLVLDRDKDQVYMVNQGDDGNPLGYVPADVD